MNSKYAAIIVPLDGSKVAESAIPFAIALARRSGEDGMVQLVHVHDRGVIVANASMIDGAWEDDRAVETADALHALAESLVSATGVHVTSVLLRGPVEQTLMRHVSEQQAALMVMTTHGRSGFSASWFGSVAVRVAHSTTVPVLFVRVGKHERLRVTEPLFQHVLVPIDHAATAQTAMDHALMLGTNGVTKYALFSVVPPQFILPLPYSSAPVLEETEDYERRLDDARQVLAGVAAPYRGKGIDFDVHVEIHEQPARAILEFAQRETDLIVLPIRRGNAVARTLLGSVVDKVLRGAMVPLFLFPVT